MGLRHIAGCALAASVAGSATAQTETMYAIDDPIIPFLLTLDKETGMIDTVEMISGHESLFGGLAVDGAGDLYSIDGFNDGEPDRTFRIDRETGDGEVVGPTGFNWNFRNVTVDPTTDTLYASRDNELFTIDRETGAATSVAPITGPTLDQLTTFAIDSEGNAYGTDIGGTGLFQIDLSTGGAVHLGDLGESNYFFDLAFDEDDVLYGSYNNGQMYTIDIGEVALTQVWTSGYRGIVFFIEGGACAADCNGDGSLDVLDFVCFQSEWVGQTPTGDCDGNGAYDVLDFVCYQGVFQDGCP